MSLIAGAMFGGFVLCALYLLIVLWLYDRKGRK